MYPKNQEHSLKEKNIHSHFSQISIKIFQVEAWPFPKRYSCQVAFFCIFSGSFLQLFLFFFAPFLVLCTLFGSLQLFSVLFCILSGSLPLFWFFAPFLALCTFSGSLHLFFYIAVSISFLFKVMSELAGYYGGVTSVVCYILPWVVSILLAIMLYRIIQVSFI